MVVDFFIAGGQKCGTTALDRYLRAHSSIQMALTKEVHFFDDESIDWTIPGYVRLHSVFNEDANYVLRGEATPIYTYWPRSLERIRAYNPAAKIIVGLRHPSFRAYSHWKMETARGWEVLSFREAVDWPARQRVRHAPDGVHRVFSYVERGFYSEQVERLLNCFPRAQTFFFRTDKLWLDPTAVLNKIQEFLGLERCLNFKRAYMRPVSGLTSQRIPASERLFLDKVFAEDIRRTAENSGILLDDWLDPNYVEPMAPG